MHSTPNRLGLGLLVAAAGAMLAVSAGTAQAAVRPHDAAYLPGSATGLMPDAVRLAPRLASASITFTIPEGDDKDTDTAVSVTVTAPFSGGWRLTLAHREGFANTDTWEDTGDKSYTYQLNTSAFDITQLTGAIQTRIQIAPVGNDEVKFGYHVDLKFIDPADPNNSQLVTQAKDGITLNQDNRTYVSP